MYKKNLALTLMVTAVLAAPLAQADDAGTTTISNTAFIDFTSINTKNNGATVDPDGYGLDVTRWYLTVLHTIDDTWSTNLTTDFNLPKYTLTGTDSAGATVKSTGNAPETQLFIKKAYLQGKLDDWAVLRIGSADTPWAPFVDNVYGYRFVEKTLTDKYGYANTADWGVNLSGAGGAVSYSASLLNGGGYKNPSRSKGLDFEGRLGIVPVDGLSLAFGLYSGKRGLDTETTPAQNTAQREDALVGWKGAGLNLGVEYFTADKWNDVLNAGATTKSDGYSLFGSYDIPDTDFAVYGRYDRVKPKQDTAASLTDKYYNGGFAWKTNKNLTWAAGFKSEKLSDGAATDLKTDEIGVWAQVKF